MGNNMIEIPDDEQGVYDLLKDVYEEYKQKDPKMGQRIVHDMILVFIEMGGSSDGYYNMIGVYYDFDQHIEK